MTVPLGFVPHTRSSPVTRPWEPIYALETDDRLILGIEVAEAHTNARGLVHGGLIAALADNAMGLSLGRHLVTLGRSVERGAVTTSLSLDYLGRAEIGMWLTFETGFIHAGRRTAVTEALVRADGTPVARANAAFTFS